MFRASLVNGWRNISRNPLLGVIKIAGSTVGLLCFVCSYLYFVHETTYDQFPESQRIYRYVHRLNLPEGMMEQAVTAAPTGPSLKDRFPEIESYCRITPQAMSIKSTSHEDGFNEKKFVFADSTFLTFFPFELKSQAAGPLLSKPYSIIISAAAAKKYFGDKDPVGQVLLGVEDLQFAVTGVLVDQPTSSHLGKLDFIASFSSLEPIGKNKNLGALIPASVNLEHKGFNFFYTYLLMAPNANVDGLIEGFPAYIEEFRGKGRSERLKPTLQSMSTIHLHSNLLYEIDKNGSVNTINVFLLIGAVILLISNINFINISTSEFIRRAKDVGIRKVLGTSRFSLVVSFTIETMLVYFASAVLSVMLIYLIIPGFNTLVDRQITVDFVVLISVIVPLWIVCSLLSSLYPAIYITRISPVEVVRMRFSMGKSVGLTRNGLVFLQICVSLVLVSTSVIIFRQLDYLLKKDPGFDNTSLLQISTLGTDKFELDFYRKEITRLPGILDAAGTSNGIGENALSFGVKLPESGDEDRNYKVITHFVDPSFLQTMKLSLTRGRFLQSDIITDSVTNVVINETAERTLFGDESGVDRKILVPNLTGSGNTTMNIVGVVKDFNHASLHNVIEPLLLMWRPTRFNYLFVRYAGSGVDATRELGSEWKKTFVGKSFEYTPVEQSFEQMYSAERSLRDLIVVFALIAVGVASVGLFGTALFEVEQRTREFGIRKVLGADSQSLHMLFSQPFAVLLVSAFLVGAPLSWYFAQDWLSQFPYRTEITPFVFVVPFVLIATIIVVTLLYHYGRLSKLNAVDVLKEM